MRKTTQLSENTKQYLKDLQRTLKFKNESQVVSYLISFYSVKFPNLTVTEHQACMEQMNEIESFN